MSATFEFIIKVSRRILGWLTKYCKLKCNKLQKIYFSCLQFLQLMNEFFSQFLTYRSEIEIASKKWLNVKSPLTNKVLSFFLIWPLLRGYCRNWEKEMFGFLEELKTKKNSSEPYWPLADDHMIDLRTLSDIMVKSTKDGVTVRKVLLNNIKNILNFYYN